MANAHHVSDRTTHGSQHDTQRQSAVLVTGMPSQSHTLRMWATRRYVAQVLTRQLATLQQPTHAAIGAHPLLLLTSQNGV
jgi:hypothetical protein